MIVAYVYKSDQLCPPCALRALPTRAGERFDGWARTELDARGRPSGGGCESHSANDQLREIAEAFGYDIDALGNWSGEFPVRFTRDEVENHIANGATLMRCSHCSRDLLT